ncbi:MAG: T9SS type A sorting domain-containing protein [Flavobacteriaceae bacterium]
MSAQTIEFTSAELTTAEIGSTVTVDYKYTIAADGYIYCAIELLDDWTWSANVANAELLNAVAGTDVTGSFELVIPVNITPSADLTGNLNYKLKIELKQNPSDWLAGAYPATQINMTASTASVNEVDNILNNIKVFPNPANEFIELKGISNLENSNVRVTNVLGKEVFKSNLVTSKINVSKLNSGIYILSIQSENKLKNIKFIKQ